MQLGRGRGRPCKELQDPSMDGFPEHGTGEEKQRWLKMKATEIWRYNILTSNQGAEYRRHENACVREYNHEKKAAAAASASQLPPPTDVPTPDVQDVDLVQKVKEQSRLRYIKYVK